MISLEQLLAERVANTERLLQTQQQALEQHREQAASSGDPRVATVGDAIEPLIADMIFEPKTTFERYLGDIGDVARAAIAALDGIAP